jgi:hypothetical protein
MNRGESAALMETIFFKNRQEWSIYHSNYPLLVSTKN